MLPPDTGPSVSSRPPIESRQMSPVLASPFVLDVGEERPPVVADAGEPGGLRIGRDAEGCHRPRVEVSGRRALVLKLAFTRLPSELTLKPPRPYS